MNLVILELSGLSPSRMLQEEGMASVRRLLEMGLSGTVVATRGVAVLDLSEMAEALSNLGCRRAIAETVDSQATPDWQTLRTALGEGVATCVRWSDAGSDHERLDAEIGETLGGLDDKTVLLVVSGDGDAGSEVAAQVCDGSHEHAFVMAGAGLPAFGPIEGVRAGDLAATLLELAGHDPGPEGRGRSLLASSDVLAATATAEELVRERLRGLGYIA